MVSQTKLREKYCTYCNNEDGDLKKINISKFIDALKIA